MIIAPDSKPGQNEILIKVIATGSNPKDWKVRRSCIPLNIPLTHTHREGKDTNRSMGRLPATTKRARA